jgi:hypothetical protein
VTNFSKNQLDKIRALLEKVGVKAACPVCRQGTLVLDRGQFGLQEAAQPPETPTGEPGGTAGRTATCVLLACNTCGFVRMHSLAAIGLDHTM